MDSKEKEVEFNPIPELSREQYQGIKKVFEAANGWGLPIGPSRSPSLSSLPEEEAITVINAQLRRYGPTNIGMETRFWYPQSPDQPLPVMANLTVFSSRAGLIHEVLFACLNGGEWDLVIAETDADKVTITSQPAGKFLRELEKAGGRPPEGIETDPFFTSLEMIKNQSIKKWMETLARGGRSLWIGAEAIMIISNIDHEVNKGRSAVACRLWQIHQAISAMTGLPIPRLIGNGYKWQVEEMGQTATTHGISTMEKVILEEGEGTMAHSPRMVEQIGKLPKSCVFVTSGTHLARTLWCLQEGVRETPITFLPCEAPCGIGPEELNHEIERLEKHRQLELKEDPPTEWNIPLALAFWQKAGMLPS